MNNFKHIIGNSGIYKKYVVSSENDSIVIAGNNCVVVAGNCSLINAGKSCRVSAGVSSTVLMGLNSIVRAETQTIIWGEYFDLQGERQYLKGEIYGSTKDSNGNQLNRNSWYAVDAFDFDPPVWVEADWFDPTID